MLTFAILGEQLFFGGVIGGGDRVGDGVSAQEQRVPVV